MACGALGTVRTWPFLPFTTSAGGVLWIGAGAAVSRPAPRPPRTGPTLIGRLPRRLACQSPGSTGGTCARTCVTGGGEGCVGGVLVRPATAAPPVSTVPASAAARRNNSRRVGWSTPPIGRATISSLVRITRTVSAGRFDEHRARRGSPMRGFPLPPHRSQPAPSRRLRDLGPRLRSGQEQPGCLSSPHRSRLCRWSCVPRCGCWGSPR